eukprot:gene7733-15814_t
MDAVISWLKVLPLFLLLLWSVKSFFVYFTWTAESAYDDFFDAVMKPFGIPASTGQHFNKATIHEYFNSKKALMRVHVTLAMIWAICMFINLMPIIRKKAMWLHRLSGKVFNITFILATPWLVWITWNVKLGPIVAWSEVPLAPITAYFCIKGYNEIQRKEVMKHRSSMIMAAAGPFFFLNVRAMVVFYQFLSTSFSHLGGPLIDPRTLSGQQYIDYAFGSGAVMSLFLCYGVAVYNAYIAEYKPPPVNVPRRHYSTNNAARHVVSAHSRPCGHSLPTFLAFTFHDQAFALLQILDNQLTESFKTYDTNGQEGQHKTPSSETYTRREKLFNGKSSSMFEGHLLVSSADSVKKETRSLCGSTDPFSPENIQRLDPE